MSVRILEGDALTVLKTLPDQSVQCCVTSPPYFGLRDYGVSGQLGLEKTPQLYVDAMVGVFSEVKRVLRDDGTLWLNIGDSYAGSGKGGNPDPGSSKQATNRGSQSVGCLYGETGKSAREAAVTNVTRKTFDGIKAKDLIGVPWLLAFGLRADGWYLRSEIIWHKLNPMPESVLDRPTKSHEQIFLLSKSPGYFFDADAIAEPAEYREDERPFGDAGENRHGDEGRVYKPRQSVARGGFNGKTNAMPGREAFRAITQTRNARSVWSIPTNPYREAHFATFPPKLIEPCILAGSARQACEKCGAPWARDVESTRFRRDELEPGDPRYRPNRYEGAYADINGKGDAGYTTRKTFGFKPTCECENEGTATSTVLDPFGGAGTTGLVADRLGRNALLIELNPKYAEMARKRIHSDNPLFTDCA